MEHPFGYFEFYNGSIGRYMGIIHETGQIVEADSSEEMKGKVDEAIRSYYKEHPQYRSDILKRYSYVRFRVIDIDTL